MGAVGSRWPVFGVRSRTDGTRPVPRLPSRVPRSSSDLPGHRSRRASRRPWPVCGSRHAAQPALRAESGSVPQSALHVAGAAVFAVGMERVLRPFLVAVYSIPKIALAPLIVMWFGLGLAPKIILAGAFVFFVVFMNAV